MSAVGEPEDLTCRELVELVTAYLDGALPPDEHTRFELHLVYCQGCANHLEQMRRTVRLLGRLPDEQHLDSAALDELLDAFRHWHRSRELPR